MQSTGGQIHISLQGKGEHRKDANQSRGGTASLRRGNLRVQQAQSAGAVLGGEQGKLQGLTAPQQWGLSVLKQQEAAGVKVKGPELWNICLS